MNAVHLIAVGFTVSFLLFLAAAVSGVAMRSLEFYRWCMSLGLAFLALTFGATAFAIAEKIEDIKAVFGQF